MARNFFKFDEQTIEARRGARSKIKNILACPESV
jgi:hypothetical protein